MFLQSIMNWFRSSSPITDGWLAVCIPFTKHWEGCRLAAYWDPYGNVWTIGYGATGGHITEGTRWSQSQADQDLMARLSVIGDELDAALQSTALNDYQKAALVDFTYNEGIGTFLDSSVLTKLRQYDFPGAMTSLLLYTKANGRFMQGLSNRRQAEVSLFES